MTNTTEQKRRKRNRKIWLGVIVLICAGIFFWNFNKGDEPEVTRSSEQIQNQNIDVSDENKTIKKFSGAQFKELYDSIAYPNTAPISEDSLITGNPQADAKIRELAEARGYKSRAAPVNDNLKEAEDGMFLQPLASEDWKKLKKSANRDGMKISISEAYRSADDQTGIFLNQLGSIELKSVANGQSKARIDEILKTTALPGYSRHHTGYTVDIVCDSDPAVKFENSKCFVWLSEDNYQKAKENGWIPSYPENAGRQGPDPEAWEYVWVGKERTYE